MFCYTALPSPTSYRVLVLYSGVAEEELRATLVLDDLDEQKQDYEYEALSYFWGPRIFPRKIRIDGEYLSITPNAL